ncbi:DUF3243 domain-containing protein [Cohnella cellulosilytica]|uniref:DUF3243 domain-containing protein n=1 Tax=Cohnella cellulosilytica TaxID=986710 RepID=A0ABW2F9X8_9BACL
MSEHNHVVDKDGDIAPDQVGDAIARIEPAERDRILSNFERFKGYLHKRIRMAESIGMNEEQMAIIAQEVAGYLASHEEPRNSEELLLQELWKAGTEEQRHALAHMLVRLAQESRTH